MEGLARKICAILRSRQAQDSEFQIKDVRYIRARVKVVKCFVNNMAIDISFNQTAGLSTLCFLEQVDQLIGKDHLYKQSIILTKAWCYYESRILGAQYGLIASYGLETLVLFIINRFHSSLRGPLEVLHRFLEYYSTFDWGNYGISINGPFALSSLPEIIVTPQNEGEEFLLSEEFVRECRLAFPDPVVANAARVDEFQIKFLNIVDPLKDNNNLGRSVSKGNFCRIRSAFSLGAKKLREVLMLPGECRGMTLEKFFATTLDRNGGGQRADLATPVPGFGTRTSEKSDLTGDYEEYCDSLLSANAYQFSITHNGAPPFEADDMSKWNALVHTAQQDGNVIFQMAENAEQIFSCLLPHQVMQNQNNSTNVPPRARGKVPESSSCGLRMKSPQKTNQAEVSIKAGPSGNAPRFKFLPEEQNDSTNVSPRARGKIPESSSRGPRMKSPQKTNQVEVSTETGPSENAPQFKFSPEEFPQLPGTQMPSSSDVHQSAQTELASPPAKEFPQVTAATICFKRFKLDNDNDFPPLT
ncbi:uncharacterized protein LOC125468176 isoform X2 [Pyrus x bretschneideri]|nr:uncharacterized protein LOC125468176 isoform X2 [Pyrus x bretschneideri]